MNYILRAVLAAVFTCSQMAYAQNLPSNTVKMGTGTQSNKQFIFDRGSGATNPRFRWNETTDRLQFTNDGVLFRDFGSGGGGGDAGVNLLQNPGFEDGALSNWSNTGGTYAEVTAGANLLFGEKSVTFTASGASQFFESALVTIPEGLAGRNCQATIFYKGGSTSLRLEVLDGSNNEIVGRAFEAAATTSRPFGVTFPCGAAGSQYKLRVESTGSSAIVAVDRTTLGELVLVDTQSPQLVVAAHKAAATSCIWNVTSTTYADFPVDTDCTGLVVDVSSGIGQVVTTDDDLPQVTINNLPAGTYRATFTFSGNYGATTTIGYRLSDGTTPRGEQTIQTDSTFTPSLNLTGVWSYASTGNRTFRVQGRAGTNLVSIPNQDSGTQRFQVIVERIPDQQGAFRPDQVAWYVDGNIGTTGATNFALGTSSISTYTEMTDGSMELTLRSGSIAAQIACSGTNPSTGTTCSAGSESNGIAFTVPSPGAVLACASFGHQVLASSGSVNAYFQVVETPNNAQTILQEGGGRMQSYIENSVNGHPVRVCGTFNFTSAGLKTLRVMYEQVTSGTIGTNQVNADEGASLGQRDIKWEVFPVTQAVPAPLLVNSVVSSSAGVERVERVRVTTICSTSTCTIDSQSGSWVTSITRSSAGTYALNIAAGVFSSTPTCVCNARDGTQRSCMMDWGTPSATLKTFVTTTFAEAAIDTRFEIVCTGPR